MTNRKKLIEVALPLDAINKASAREKSIRHGHPSTLHLWWARRPLAAARAVLFSQMVDDPSSYPDLFPTEKKQEQERTRLFKIIEDLVQWENTTNEEVLQRARDEIWQSWRRACAENADHPRAAEIFNRNKLPAFHDPFAGGGALPLEAQRLGMEAYASDLNPVAVLINKAMIEIPPKFAGLPPVNPESRRQGSGNRRQELGNKGREEIGNSALSGSGGVAEGDGSCKGNLSDSTPSSPGGSIRDAVTDNEGGNISSGQHRGGLDKGVGQGEGTVSGNSAGIAGRDRDISDTVRTDRMDSGEGDDPSSSNDDRSGKNVDYYAQEFSRKGLKANSYTLFPVSYKGAQGLAEDVRYYGKWMRDEAERRIGHLYPKVKAWRDPRTGRYYGEAEVEEWRRTEGSSGQELGNSAVLEEMQRIAGDSGHSSISSFLSSLSCEHLTVIAWLWARTVKSPNPAFRDVDVPLASTFMLSTKPGKEAYVDVVIEDRKQGVGNSNAESPDNSNSHPLSSTSSPPYRFTVKTGKPADPETAKNGTKLSRGANFQCLMSGIPISPDYVYTEANAGRMGARLMAIVAEGKRGRVYLSPTPEHEAAAQKASPEWAPDVAMPDNPRWFSPPLYGLKTYGDLFTTRQLVALTTFSDLVGEAMERVKADALEAGLPDDGTPLRDGGQGPTAYAEAVGVYLAFAVDRLSDYNSSLTTWKPSGEQVMQTFKRQAIPMTWDFPESNTLGQSAICWHNAVKYASENLLVSEVVQAKQGFVLLEDAITQILSTIKLISTDPPYYDNVGYADLSDFFYVWLRRSLRGVFPDLFSTVAVPKAEELIASPYRHGGREKAEAFFLDGMTRAMGRLSEQSHPAFPVTIYYAFKQSEARAQNEESGDSGRHSSTGWQTFLEAVLRAGFAVTGTWPMRTELANRMVGRETNALASSIVLVCRKRMEDAPVITRRQFISELKTELPAALVHLQRGNIAPVDLAQSAIGPGMAIYTRYSKVIDAEGRQVSVREALALINQTLDEVLAEQEGDFDADTRWAVAWFEQMGFAEGQYGVAETLSKAKNTSVNGMVTAGIIVSGGGKVRLKRPNELQEGWDPQKDVRPTAWEAVHHLIHVLEKDGEEAAAALVKKLGAMAETARELCYRLFTLCERKKRAQDALSYNTLVQSWPEIMYLAGLSSSTTVTPTASLFEDEETV